MLRLTALSVFLASLLASVTQAAVVVALSDDGKGATRMQITGAYDFSGAGSFGPTNGADLFGAYPALQALRMARTTPGTQSRGSQFSPAASNQGSFFSSLGSAAFVGQSQLTANNILLAFRGPSAGDSGLALLADYGPADGYTGTLSEDVTFSALSFSLFNAGEWNYTELGALASGNTLRLVIQPAPSASVPVPASIFLGLTGLAGLAAFRRRKTQ